MKKLELRGETPEQKLKHVEKILQHFSRRLGKKVVEKVPAIPISGFKAEATPNDNIIHYLLPFDCELLIAHAFVGSRPSNVQDLYIDIEIFEKFGTSSFTIFFNRKTNRGSVEVNRKVKAGTIIKARVQEHIVNDATVSISIVPDSFGRKEHLIDSLTNDLEENI